MADTTIPIASVLGISMSLLGITWRSYYADKLRQFNIDQWKDDDFAKGLAGFLLVSLAIHILWLLASIGLAVLGQKGVKLVIWGWILATWLSIVVDTGFFGCVAYQAESIKTMIFNSILSGMTVEQAVLLFEKLPGISGFYTGLIGISFSGTYLPLLLVHMILAYVTVQVGCYALRLDTTKIKDQVFGPAQSNDPYIADQYGNQLSLGSRGYQNQNYSRSAEDLRDVAVNYVDRRYPKYRRYAAPEEIPPPDYRRASRQNIEIGRY